MISWRKSTYSAASGDCIEVGWRKSSYSASNGGCVEVSWPVTGVGVRDSKQAVSPELTFPVTAWHDFLRRHGTH
jgi:hypothetical protein